MGRYPRRGRSCGLRRSRGTQARDQAGRSDFGDEIGEKKTSAQITRYYEPETLPSRQVAAVVNFPQEQTGKFMSEVFILGFPDGDSGVVLVDIERPVANGTRLF